MHRRLISVALAAAALAVPGPVATGAAVASPHAGAAPAAAPTRAQLVGQRLMVSMQGTQPDAALLARVQAGQVGGIILFGSNIVDAAQLTTLTQRLQRAAAKGGQPPLLIATDQEGGLVRRLSWAPPRRSAAEMGQLSTDTVHTIGEHTGAALKAVGINFDLAPVADIPRSASNFIGQQQRAFSTNRFVVSDDVSAFAHGLEAGGALPAIKHFPGLGRAGSTSTDDAVVTIDATTTQLVRDVLPYRLAIRRLVRPVIMLSTAVYPAYSPKAAAWSTAIGTTLLRGTLGFKGVTITDSLASAAAVRHAGEALIAERCARHGDDILLVTGSEAATQQVYEALLAKARSGVITASNLQTSYDRILKLKGRL
ncbi:MAG TPA: glycoside hydrolase family 3 N-terminal domain-containing protein [Gaiellales bacterium]|nr:glycoside hydrolase family 3 N-terminal domain-containing protein [Gaiellales bacterium]